MTTIPQKHSLDDSDASPIGKRPKRDKITRMAEDMCKSIQVMQHMIERRYSNKIADSDLILELWRTACTKGINQEDWMSDERELLNERLPEDAHFSLSYNHMYHLFSLKPQDGVKEAQRVLNSIQDMKQKITDVYNKKKRTYMDTFDRWMIACEKVCDGLPVPQPHLDVRLPNGEFYLPIAKAMTVIITIELDIDLYNDKYQSFADLIQLHVKSLLPSPSDFGKDGRWGEEQRKEGRIYCLRPSDARSLPLCILHHVSRQYLLDIKQPLPLASDTAVTAQRIAAQLCERMGMSVTKKSTTARDERENRRTKEFDACISDFLGKIEPMYNLNSRGEAHGGIADGALLTNGIIIALRQMKAEPGASGDAYMQVARCYDLAVKLLQQNRADAFLRQGAPMFLLCVVGPLINVSGGFYDGKKVIVEPLTAYYHTLEDPLFMRQAEIARVLYALRKGINTLEAIAQKKNKHLKSSFPPSTPRIYSSCTLYTRHNHAPPSEGRLEFQQMTLSHLLLEHNSLLFIGTLSGIGPVFVKLASKYGENVHRLLEEENLAPKLYAKSEVEGAPTAYIMEYLEPSSWKMLHSFAARSGNLDYKEPVRLSIKNVLKILHENNMVHGDLRTNNIMVQVSRQTGKLVCFDDEGPQRASIKIIDFDWSGETGEVYYSPTRNEGIQGLTWPGKPGFPIEQDHDEQLFESWWRSVGKEVEDESSLQSEVSEV
ncbi:hypothetical protein APHAL10511_004248 [Amanita phalloides]|nr:hypothetical protein APHAL10511_004248 [Amanita phalloides]